MCNNSPLLQPKPQISMVMQELPSYKKFTPFSQVHTLLLSSDIYHCNVCSTIHQQCCFFPVSTIKPVHRLCQPHYLCLRSDIHVLLQWRQKLSYKLHLHWTVYCLWSLYRKFCQFNYRKVIWKFCSFTGRYLYFR